MTHEAAVLDVSKFATLFNIMRYSIKDGPGIRTTVFFKGCPLSCWWCHNPEGQAFEPEILFQEARCTGCGECVAVCPIGVARLRQGNGTPASGCTACGKCADVCYSEARTMAGRRYTQDDIMREIRRDLLFYDQSGGGVTFSGGEPLAQGAFLAGVLVQCKAERIHTAVDTSGYCRRDLLLDVSKHVDLFLYDLKLMDNEKHRRYTGVGNETILHNLQSLSAIHSNVHVRIPLIPGVNDDARNIEQTGEFLRDLGNIRSITVLPYHRSGVGKYAHLSKGYFLPETRDPAPEDVARAVESLRRHGLPAGV